MFGAFRCNDSTGDNTYIDLSSNGGVDGRGYALVVSYYPPGVILLQQVSLLESYVLKNTS